MRKGSKTIVGVTGCGFVGLTTAVGLAQSGCVVVAAETNSERLDALQRGISPIEEDSISDDDIRNAKIEFVKVLPNYVDVNFICVDTPNAKGAVNTFDLTKAISNAPGRIIVIKSTVIPGFTRAMNELYGDDSKKFVYAPEFFQEGSALQDFMRPKRPYVIAGDVDAVDVVTSLHETSKWHHVSDWETAEFIKYASNIMLASRVSMINELAALAEKFGADITDVAFSLRQDPRIGHLYLKPSIGFGGHCLPKDLEAMRTAAPIDTPMLDGITAANEEAFFKLYNKFSVAMGIPFEGRSIAFLGLGFKPDSSDMRHSPVERLRDILTKEGFQARVWRKDINLSIPESWCVGSAGVVVTVTGLDLKKISDFLVKRKVFCDPYGLYHKAIVEHFGMKYIS